MQPLIHKYALLVASDPAAPEEVGDRLSSQFTLLGTCAPHEMMPQVQQSPLLSCVVIDGEVGPKAGATLLVAIKDLHPDLPVIWLARGSQSLSVFGDYAPDIISPHAFDPQDLEGMVEGLLHRHLYPEMLVKTLGACIEGVLRDVYHVEFATVRPFLKANRNLLARVNALLVFCGKGISGRMIVSSVEAQLARIYARLFPGAPPASLMNVEDLAGEIGNLILGRLKVFFSQYGLSFELGSPIFIRDEHVKLRYKAGRPSLVLRFAEGADVVFVEFCLDQNTSVMEFPPPRLDAQPQGDTMEDDIGSPGEINFF